MKERLLAALCITSALIFLVGAALAYFLIAGDGGNTALGVVIGTTSLANLVFAILMFRRIDRRRVFLVVVFLSLLAAEMFGIIELQRRYRIADIITDEAEWDLRDNANM